MVDKSPSQESSNFVMSDFSTRLRDIDERSRLIRERVLLLGKNLISSRQELDLELKELKKENIEMKREISDLKRITKSLISDSGKFARKDEMMMIERMLKDFQPLEFARKKDFDELVERLDHHNKKQIKTDKS